ncbi:glycosyltransferase family 4 protein [Echinicola jeungdonensis]|uniref:Glycosyltransferase family 4 protein n=1 Tax=Echinicola jeungdonensis TaxID=709343 RepID=A0ABV5J218_9BACT|nr:glycosyltransferase family 4 protein [Echinicola jeungdonensis]MDN3671154.1 glycosyltransferase family 4 protein [Echinicola jeungdonensis]
MKQDKSYRILFYIGSLMAGGKERRLLELLNYLKKNTNFEMFLVITVDNVHYNDYYDLEIPILPLYKEKKKNHLGIILNFYRLCKKIKPHIIHTWGSKQTFYAIPAVVSLKISLVNSQIASAPPHQYIWSLDTWIDRINFYFSSIILANSKAGVESYRPPLEKTRVIYNGISLDRFKNLPDKSKVKSDYKIETPFLVIMSASFSVNKDHQLFLEIAEKITSIREDISFIGIGAHDINNPLYDALVKKSLENPKIYFPGRVKEVEALVNACDIGVLFSNEANHGEGISNSVLEYMALGKPVIANDTGGTKELVKDQKNGYLIKKQSLDEIIQLFLDLIDNEPKRLQFGAEGKKIAEKQFSIERMGSEFNQVYQGILNTRP